MDVRLESGGRKARRNRQFLAIVLPGKQVSQLNKAPRDSRELHTEGLRRAACRCGGATTIGGRSRCVAMAAGLLTFTQASWGPDLWGESTRFDSILLGAELARVREHDRAVFDGNASPVARTITADNLRSQNQSTLNACCLADSARAGVVV
jgi:hypothetical protein